MTAVAGAALTLHARRGLASAVPEPPPRTVTQALDRLETLMSPEALAVLFAASEKELLGFEIGIEQLMELYWQRPCDPSQLQACDQPPPSLASALAARHVAPNDTAAYLLTSLWRRRKGLPLDRDRQLLVFREHRKWHAEAVGRVRHEAAARGIVISDLGSQTISLLESPAYFRHGTIELEAGQEQLVRAVAETLRSNLSMFVEAQGHAAMGESHPDELSRSRARAVRSGLQQNGVQASRLTAHGLGARCLVRGAICPPICTSELTSAPARDRRVDFVILRQDPWRPEATEVELRALLSGPARDAGVVGPGAR